MHFFRSLLFFAGRREKCTHLCGAFDQTLIRAGFAEHILFLRDRMCEMNR